MSNILLDTKVEVGAEDVNNSAPISDSVLNEIYSLEDNDDILDDMPRKYGLSLFFRHFVCCSCFTTEHDNSKYKLNSPSNNSATKSLPSTLNGKRKKINDTTKPKSRNVDKTKENMEDNDVELCTNLAQALCASDTTDNSPNLGDSNQTIKIKAEEIKLLPEISDKNKNKKCLIIDLDETLVHSSFKYVKTADILVSVEIDGTQHQVYVCKRPYVDEFLKELGHLFECVLFTASLGKYADPVTDFLDPEGIFEARLFREACAFKDGNYIKDLDMVGRNIDNIIILDNSPVSYLLHPTHALQIVSWFDDVSDTALKDLIPYFKDMAASSLSVPEWLQRNRPPESAGILGHPPSNLHWILMRTLSVPEAVIIYKQRLRESFYTSGSSNVSRRSSARGHDMSHEPQLPHHSLITQAINTGNRRNSLSSQETEDDRPPVSSPVARPSSAVCLEDESNIDDDNDYLIVTCPKNEVSDSSDVYHSNEQIKSQDSSAALWSQ